MKKVSSDHKALRIKKDISAPTLRIVVYIKWIGSFEQLKIITFDKANPTRVERKILSKEYVFYFVPLFT